MLLFVASPLGLGNAPAGGGASSCCLSAATNKDTESGTMDERMCKLERGTVQVFLRIGVEVIK